jgi:phenylacetaldehyde dehydrogenase
VWRPAELALDHWLDDPNTGEHLQQQAGTSAEVLDEALETADAVHSAGTWARTRLRDRHDLLHAVADAIDGRIDEIARCEAINSGVPIAITTLMAEDLGQRFRSAARALLEVPSEVSIGSAKRPVRRLRLPLGPALITTAWNASTFIAASRVASALAAGCPVILKPSEWAPWGCQIVAEEIARAEIPPGVFQLVHGGPQQGAQLVADPRTKVISFTGGQEAGRQVASAASAHFKTMQLELGGNNPVIVCRDADPQLAASALAEGMTRLNGQWCEGPGRVFVSQELHDELLAHLLSELRSLRSGHSLDPNTTFGPLAYGRHRDHLTRQVDSLRERGGVVHQPMDIPPDGYYMSPTVVTELDPHDATDELFGPIVTIHGTNSDDDSVELANHPASGLDAYVFGTDLDASLEIGVRIIAGEVRVNGMHLSDLGPDSGQTFWDSAGIGGHAPPAEMLELFRGYRVVGVDDPDAVV